ncbi:DUF1254 domain-containing protein [Yinghuangia seranimata]|uniref:DUF1254 domain-containing protein n=1 Tax=Yinghuangia seranimata TaxID=408067 RepID=UPI00248AD881|nr:DUF1254 domain-containing protein [Yinghuangia seranimata]MDI2127680.1 DUF1254 domain-containing protein [Yinghuangia seranimata]
MTDHDELTALAAEAYVYGYPLVYNAAMIAQLGHGGFGSIPGGPPNTFGHADRLASPGDEFVSVNNDTVYSIAWLDLSGGPLLLRVPDTGGAYYVLQFVDAWTNNFAYIGRRATGTGEGTYLVTPPGWTGTPPDGARVVEAPEYMCVIVGRFACDGPDDLPRVAALQQGLTLAPHGTPGPLTGLPAPDHAARHDLAFWEQLRVLMAAFPPGEDEGDHQMRFAALGLLHEGATPYRDTSDALAAALVHGLALGKEHVEGAARSGFGDRRGDSTWQMALHAFDYNLDHLGLGCVDSPDWKTPGRHAAHLARAAAARAGLWGNHGYEAAYAVTFTDADGETLDGGNTYTLTFPSPPPVDAFWSITMYDTPDYYLVDNAANRYSIGDRTPGLVYEDDGSLVVYLQHTLPVEGEAANWLPTPAGGFRPMLRMYQPGKDVLEGHYLPPDIRRTVL